MSEYRVTYKTQEGVLEERRITARNHKDAVKHCVTPDCEVISVHRLLEDDGETNDRIRIGAPERSVLFSVLLGLVVAVLVIAYFWMKK